MRGLLRIAICGLLVMAMMGIASAYTENFQNYAGDWVVVSGAGASSGAYTYSDTYGLLFNSGFTGFMRQPELQSTNYVAITLVSGANAGIAFVDSGGSRMASVNFMESTPGRYVMIRESNVAYLYLNGNLIDSKACPDQPYGFCIGKQTTDASVCIFDDAVVGANELSVVGCPPHTWFVGKDILDPSVKGLFNAAYTNVYTDYFHYTIANNTSSVIGTYALGADPPTSGTITITSGTASDYIDCRAVALSGTNISWSKTEYAANDVANLNWTISDEYWDTTTFDYKFKVYEYSNGTTTLKQTTAINTANGTGTYQTTQAGTYTVALILDYKTAPNTDYWLDSDWMSVVQGVVITGTAYDAFNGTPIVNATVYCAQSSNNQSVATNATGGYTCPYTLSTGQSSSFRCNKINYTSDVFTYTFTKAGTYQVDLNLLPYNDTSAPVIDGTPIWNGTAIYGLILSYPYNAAVEGATVTLSDGNTTTSSATGYYHFDNLTDNTTYTITANKTGYASGSASATTGVSNSGTRADVYLNEGFTVTVNLKDATTGSFLSNGTVYVNGAYAQNIAGGYTTYTLQYGTYTITGTSTKYYESSQSVDVSGNQAITLYLTPTTDSLTYTNLGPGQSYPPHNVRFTVQTLFGVPIENVTVTAIGTETTAGSFAWLYDILGVSNVTPIANTTLNGTTDHLGQINFMMFEAVKYQMSFQKEGYIDVNWTFYPKDEFYTVVASPMSNATWYQGGYNVQEVVNSSVVGYETNGTIVFWYTDSINSTTGGKVWINQTNKTNVTLPETTIYNFTIPSANATNASNFSLNYSPSGYAGQSYIVRFRMNSTTFTQQIARDYSVMFRPAQINPMGLSDFELMLISVFLLIFLGCFFGAVQAPQGPILVCFVGWILWIMGWMNAMGAVAPIALTLATVVSIAVLIMVRSRKGTWF